MIIFEDIQDVEAWVAPMGYADLLDATGPYGVFSEEERMRFDAQIAAGVVTQAKVLAGLKVMVRLVLTDRFGLTDRIYDPVDRQYLQSVH